MCFTETPDAEVRRWASGVGEARKAFRAVEEMSSAGRKRISRKQRRMTRQRVSYAGKIRLRGLLEGVREGRLNILWRRVASALFLGDSPE